MKPSKNEAVGSRLKAFRKARGLTLNQLGRELDMRETRVHLLERGKARLTLAELAQMAKFFGVTTDAIVNGVQPKVVRD